MHQNLAGKRSLRAALCAGLFVALLAAAASADRGVGVSLGRIQVEDRLVRGGTYNLPSLGVINTGNEAGEYEIAIGYVDGRNDSRPPAQWFNIQPSRFFLEAGQQQNVRISLMLPTSSKPGDYFALIEAHPVSQGEGVRSGAAAATTLLFSVKPSGWLEVQRLRLNRWLDDTQPWSTVLPAAGAVVVLSTLLWRRFRIRLHVERR